MQSLGLRATDRPPPPADRSPVLLWAVALDAKRCVAALVAAGADPRDPSGGPTPLLFAHDRRSTALIRLLENAGP